MPDLKQMYLDLIQEYDPYTDLNEHINLSDQKQLYNLIEIRKNNFDFADNDNIINKFDSLINLYKTNGINTHII